MALPSSIGRYDLGKVLGKGGFGTVVCATHRHHPKTQFALKIERNTDKDGRLNRHPQLYYEYRIYRHLRKRSATHCVPSVYEFLQEGDMNILVMQEVGASVSKIFSSHNKHFSPEHVVSVGLQMLDCLEAVHDAGVLHRDVKPENFCVGTGDGQHRLFLLDFGLSKCYRKRGTGEHIPHVTGKSLTGTPRYASVRCHEGHEQSRRDDVESAIYVLLYLALGRLPWQGLKRNKRKRRHDPILPVKRAAGDFPSLHPNFAKMLAYARQDIDFDARPDYSRLRSWLADTASSAEKSLSTW